MEWVKGREFATTPFWRLRARAEDEPVMGVSMKTGFQRLGIPVRLGEKRGLGKGLKLGTSRFDLGDFACRSSGPGQPRAKLRPRQFGGGLSIP